MVTGPMLLVIFVAGILFVLISIIKFKLNPFISLLLASIFIGLAAFMPLKEIPNVVASGFGSTMTGIGIVIALGVILGQILYETGCTEQIANIMLRIFGKKNTPLAINFTGYIVSIPVFFDAAFVILVNLIKQLSRKSKLPFISLVTALAVGLITTHALVIPTPGPLAVVGNMKVDIGAFLLYSIIVSLPASLIGGWVYGLYLGKKNPDPAAEDEEDAEFAVTTETTETAIAQERPSGGLAIFLIMLPILLILLGTVMAMILPKNSAAMGFFDFVGNKNIALFLGVVAAIFMLKKYFRRPVEETITEAAKATGMIFLITGAGGSLGAMINATGIGKYIVETMKGWSISAIILAFVLSQVLRAAQGSTTVALVTTSAIMAPVAVQMGASPILVGLAICAGGIGLSLPNDSGFWVVNRFTKFSVNDTMKVWTVGGTISGVVSLIAILILDIFKGILPGL